MNLSEEVRKLSKELNITFTEIARRTGQSSANLSKKLNHETLSFEDFEKILDALGVKMECSFLLPGQKGTAKAVSDRRAESRIQILEKELELERLKNEYYQSTGFTVRTSLETISGSIELLSRHSGDPKKVNSCISRMRTAAAQLTDTINGNPLVPISEPLRQAEQLPDHSMHGKRVLVVDDNAINRDIVADLLSDSGLEADCAADGAEALDKVKAAPVGYYDFLLMDIQMPVMNGYEAAAAIRALPDARRKVPIIAMTAGASADDKEKAAAVGMNTLVLKPLNLQKLFEIINM